ncbi:MAG TPA: O-antigen ligase family protein, partial [Solirubrobacteraceae bacterium]|nr:O-antigen ligase family protein [Solirubrobacteraceae bacterium]
LVLGLGAGLLAVAFAATALQGLSVSSKVLPAIVVLAVGGLWLLARPEWLVPLFLALTWTAVGRGTFGGLPTPVEVGGPLLIGAAAWFALPRLRFARDVLVVALLLGVPVVVAGLLSPVEPGLDTGVYKDLTFLFIAALGLRSIGDVDRAAIVLCFTGIALAGGAVYSVAVGEIGPFVLVDEGSETLGTTALRAAGPFGDPNFFALSMAAIMPFALHVAARRGWMPKLLAAATAVSLLAGILATGSRGGLLATAVVLVIYAFTSPARSVRVATIASIVLAVAMTPFFSSQLGTSANRSVEGRATENLVAIAMFVDHPLTGVGPGWYPALYRDYSRDVGNDPRVMRLPHSLPLEIAAEQGIVGLLAWAAAFSILIRFVVVRRLWEVAIARAVMVALLAYLVGSLFLHGGQLRIVYMLIGMLLAVVAVTPARRRPRSPAAA